MVVRSGGKGKGVVVSSCYLNATIKTNKNRSITIKGLCQTAFKSRSKNVPKYCVFLKKKNNKKKKAHRSLPVSVMPARGMNDGKKVVNHCYVPQRDIGISSWSL